MSYLIFAWLASLFYGFFVIVTKLTSKYAITNPVLFNFLYAAGILTWTIPIALFNHAGIPHEWTNIVITGFLYALSGLFFITAIAKLDISTISPLYNFQIAFAVILSGIILHEQLGLLQYILISIIFCAGLFTTIDEKMKIHAFFKLPVLFALLGALFYALSGIFINKAVAGNSYWTVTLWVPCVTQLLLIFTFPFFRKDLKKISYKAFIAIFAIGAFDTLGTLAAIKAYAANVGISAAIISLPISLFLAIAFSLFFPKFLEKHTAKVYAIRITAAIVMVIAALKLSLG